MISNMCQGFALAPAKSQLWIWATSFRVVKSSSIWKVREVLLRHYPDLLLLLDPTGSMRCELLRLMEYYRDGGVVRTPHL
ncbi:hypothetical protein EMCG_09309 [[Emmonsia] crescens]|uniref:Uncharacterized protein n=1 Tax=[Emmonsia] crescens TaxID=73230 RepID=A0A0G2J389_9EURO|nr:hypothetical protein EMCG_09309 [Emmonsia crescens UAMH 3008]